MSLEVTADPAHLPARAQVEAARLMRLEECSEQRQLHFCLHSKDGELFQEPALCGRIEQIHLYRVLPMAVSTSPHTISLLSYPNGYGFEPDSYVVLKRDRRLPSK